MNKHKNYIDYSIEYSHIYTDETFSDEHRSSVAALKRHLPKLEGKVVDKVVFIDNYNTTNHILDIEGFLKSIKEEGVAHDYYVFEADMVHYKDQLLNAIENKKIKRDYQRYIESRGKLPCSFLTATWYLIRLGHFDPNSGMIYGKDTKEFKPARKIINVLPERFEQVELKTRKLIAATKYRESVMDIESMFFTSSTKVSKHTPIS